MKETKVNWQEIRISGMPSSELTLNAFGAPRQFLVRGEWSIAVAYMFDDLSGFNLGDSEDSAQAWAVIDGF
jgi:hypothetical protein